MTETNGKAAGPHGGADPQTGADDSRSAVERRRALLKRLAQGAYVAPVALAVMSAKTAAAAS